ncbi:CopG family transcriptional regulator [Candidatus Bipolaricaulota bacterium]|nr:CopG family transcriptional regulator [Candidatus Bipolaricaulota bacterium]
MADTEKITINLSPVDLGGIDVLVEQGLFSNRTDLIRSAIRSLLEKHERVIEDMTARKSFSIGVMAINREDLEKLKRQNKKTAYRIIGALFLANDIDPDLARETIESISVRGTLRASAALKEALKDRIKD